MKKKQEIKHKEQLLPFWKKYIAEIIIFCFVFILYANSLPNGYNLDDQLVTRQHKLTSHGLSAIPEIFSSPYYTDDAGYSYEYRPVVLASFAIENQFFGENPHISHFINLLLYACCCLILYRLLYLIIPGQAQLLCLCIALLFAAHPTHTEVVCSIKNRDEILSLSFALLAAYTAFKAVLTNKKLLLLSVPLLFLLALLSKTSAISFVFIIPTMLVLFSDAGFLTVLAVTSLVLIPAFLIIDYMLWNKITGSFLLAGCLGACYVISRSKLTGVYTQVQKTWAIFLQNKTVSAGNEKQELLRGFKNLFTGIIPSPVVFDFKAIAVVIVTAMLYCVGAFCGLPFLIVIAAIILGLLILKGSEPIWWWASVALLLCLAFLPVQFDGGKNLRGELVSAVLVYAVFFGNRKLFLPAVIILMVYTLPGFNIQNKNIYLDRLLGLSALRIFGWPAMITQVLPLINFCRHLIHEMHSPGYLITSPVLGAVIVALLMVSILLKRGSHYLITGYTVVAIMLAAFYPLDKTPSLTLPQAKDRFANVVNQVNPRLVTVKENRPLDFIEQPATVYDPQSIRLGTAFEVIGHYLVKTVWPWPMAFYYGYRYIKPETITQPGPLVALIVFSALCFLAVVLMKRNKLLSMALFIYLVSLALFSGYFYPVPGQVAERFMFIATIGWSIAVGYGLFAVFKINGHARFTNGHTVSIVPRTAFFVILSLYSVITFSRNFTWKDDITLFRHDIAYVDESVQAHNLLATHLVDRSLITNNTTEQTALREEAIYHLKKAVEIRPTFFNPVYDIGRVYLMLNMPDSALTWLIKANNLNPDYTQIQFDIAELCMRSNKMDIAIPYLQYAIKTRPTDYKGYNELSYVYFQQRNYYQSIEINRSAIANTNAGASPYVNIGRVYMKLNKPDSAALWARIALEKEPGNKAAIQMLQQAGGK